MHSLLRSVVLGKEPWRGLDIQSQHSTPISVIPHEVEIQHAHDFHRPSPTVNTSFPSTSPTKYTKGQNMSRHLPSALQMHPQQTLNPKPRHHNNIENSHKHDSLASRPFRMCRSSIAADLFFFIDVRFRSETAMLTLAPIAPSRTVIDSADARCDDADVCESDVSG